MLSGDYAGIDSSFIVSGLGNINARCVDKLNELYNERGVFTADETGNAGLPNASDNLSLCAILSDSKKRLA